MRSQEEIRLCTLWIDEHQDKGHTSCAHDPHHDAALRARAAGAPNWSAIVRGQDCGGDRDFLDGEPIHCGASLELQTIERRGDDYGEYSIKLPTGVPVRYELAFSRDEEVTRKEIVIYVGVGGHLFQTRHEAWMRFRWPER